MGRFMSCILHMLVRDQMKAVEIARHVSFRKAKNTHKILVVKREGKIQLRNLDTDGRIILKFNLQKYGVGMWTGVCGAG